MASGLDTRCAICLESWEEASYVMPCLHQFCYPCIVRWTESKPECPLCKRRVTSILHSVRGDDDFQEHVIPAPGARAAVGRQAGRAPANAAARRAAARQAWPVGMVTGAALRGLRPRVRASFFQDHPALLQPVLSWVRQELRRLFGTRSSRAGTVEALITPMLLLFGLDEEQLVPLLEATLQNRAATFVHRLMDVAARLCSREAERRLGLEDGHAAAEWEGSAVAAPGPAVSPGGSPTPGPASSNSLEGANVDLLPSTSAAALQQGPGSPPSAPIPTPGLQAEPQEEPDEAGPRPSSPSRGREGSSAGPRRALKRKAGSPEDSSPAPKRPPSRQH
ncbi:E3 ubiquitin-protein ligase Topors-like [Columba livia]|uniref:E3 ubiquitin-protein ligase Topors-like n=1 Tax=Columba livia TaxID=8932 RepID=UPI0031B9D964